jgi:hypothetical protein
VKTAGTEPAGTAEKVVAVDFAIALGKSGLQGTAPINTPDTTMHQTVVARLRDQEVVAMSIFLD